MLALKDAGPGSAQMFAAIASARLVMFPAAERQTLQTKIDLTFKNNAPNRRARANIRIMITPTLYNKIGY
jgi:hypothetical protein